MDTCRCPHCKFPGITAHRVFRAVQANSKVLCTLCRRLANVMALEFPLFGE